MADIKWINIDVDMFDDEKIVFIESLPEGEKILNIWIRLICMAGKCNSHGYIFISQGVPCSAEYLSHKFRKPINIVNLALETFQKLGMIEMNSQKLYLLNFEKHQYVKGLDKIREQNRERVARHRAKAKELKAAAAEETSADEVTLRNITCNVTGNITAPPKCNVTCSTSSSTSLYSSSSKSFNKNITKTIDNNTLSKNHAKIEEYTVFFNNNFHPITPFEAETLESYINDGMQKEVVTLALMEAVDNNKRDMRYVKKVLNRWLENKLLTVDAVEADKKEWERQKKGGKNNANSRQSAESEDIEGIGIEL